MKASVVSDREKTERSGPILMVRPTKKDVIPGRGHDIKNVTAPESPLSPIQPRIRMEIVQTTLASNRGVPG